LIGFGKDLYGFGAFFTALAGLVAVFVYDRRRSKD